MVKVYCNLIKSGKWTINDVPEKWRYEVKVLLNKEGKSTQDSTTVESLDDLALKIRLRVKAGEDLRAIINSMNLTDKEKWELENKVKEG